MINFWNFIKKPRLWFAVIFYAVFITVVTLTLVLVITKPNQGIEHYLLYFLSATLLVYFVYTCIYYAPIIKTNFIAFMKRHKFTNKLLSNYGYRTIIFSIWSFIFNVAYLVLVGTFAIISKSAWYISITIYYLVLSLVKGNVFIQKSKNPDKISQLKTYRISGIMLILLTIALSGIIVLIYTSNMYFEYAGLMIYVFATFTFYKLGVAIYNIFKAKKQSNLYIQNIRNINLASALVSIIVLQVALFQAFSPENNTSFANGLTGAFISLIILSVGIYMIIKSNKNLKTKENINE